MLATGTQGALVQLLALSQVLCVISGKMLNVHCLPVPASCPLSQLARLYKPLGKKCLPTCFCRDQQVGICFWLGLLLVTVN